MRIDADSAVRRPAQFIDQGNIAPAWQRKRTGALLRHDACGRVSRAGEFADTLLQNARRGRALLRSRKRAECNREKKK